MTIATANKIREAISGDVDCIVKMGCRFIETTSYSDKFRVEPDQIRRVAESLIDEPSGVVFLYEGERSVVGMIGVLCHQHLLTGDLVAGELFWWMDPDERGSAGIRLFKKAQKWAEQKGATELTMAAPSNYVAAIYKRLGLRFIESTYSLDLA